MGKSKKKSRKRSRSRSPSSSSDSSSSSRSRSRSPSRKKSKKSHKHSKRKHESTSSSSSSSSSSSTSIPTPTPTLTKEQMKAMETPEQRQARRLAKKQKKEEKKKQENSLYGYTDESNPFGDANLTQAFVWKKKYEKILASGGDPRQISKAAIQEKQAELRREIDQVKERRKQREIEREAMEQMREMMRREADKEAVEGWEEKEEEFHRKQAKTRTAIRITAGREKAIDILAKNLYLLDSQNDDSIPVNWDVELTEPYRIFDGLLIYDLQELKKDIQQQVELGVHLDYWNALLTVCDNEIHQQQGMAAGGKQRASAIPASVARDVQGILGGKSVNELDSLELDIKQQIKASNDGSGAIVDVVYWEAILQELAVYKAKAFLHEFHANLLKTRLKQLKQQSTSSSTASTKAPVESVKEEEDDFEKEFQQAAADEVAEDDGSFSPVLQAEAGDEESLAIVDAEEDARELEAQRRMVLEQRQAEEKERLARDKSKGVPVTAAVAGGGEPDAFARESAKPMMGDEVAFNNGEITLEETSYSWHDKYRPRKPRYFNRVKTGFEWNRYNQTHYDKENPPPKIVQGYKFNLFYPDLIDPTKAPTYRVDPDPDNPDYCTIRFSAGPPYEDIAFKIVRKEWEYTPKRGFKCVFDKGVLHLYFNFKRYFYRR